MKTSKILSKFSILLISLLAFNIGYAGKKDKGGGGDDGTIIEIGEYLELEGKLKKRKKGTILYVIILKENEAVKFLQDDGFVPAGYVPKANIDQTLVDVFGSDQLEANVNKNVKVSAMGGIRKLETKKGLVHNFRIRDIESITPVE